MAFWHCVGFMSDRSSKMMMMIAIECVALYQISKIIFIPLGWVWLMECCCWSKRLVLEVVGKCAVQTITGIHSSLYRWLTWSQITGIFEKSTNFVNYHYYLLIALACMHRPQIKSNESKSRFDRKSFSFFFSHRCECVTVQCQRETTVQFFILFRFGRLYWLCQHYSLTSLSCRQHKSQQAAAFSIFTTLRCIYKSLNNLHILIKCSVSANEKYSKMFRAL